MKVSEADILNASVLIVDDQEANVSLLEQLLGDAGYNHIASTMDSTEVCALHRKNRYDLILLDLQMPAMDGFQVNCRKALRAGDTLIVWRLDRLGRNLSDLVRIVAELELAGIGFESLTEKIETTSANGKLTFHIFASLAEFERNLIRERTHAGLAAARARGRKGGRKPALDEKQIREVKALMRDPSVNITSVAERYNVSRTTLYKYAG